MVFIYDDGGAVDLQYMNHRKMLLDSLMEGIEHKYYDIHNIFKWLVGSIQQHLLGMANKCLERLTYETYIKIIATNCILI